MPYIYFGEAAGARILRYGIGFTQVGDPYGLDERTWEFRPAGDTGEVLFRTVDILVRHTLGYSIEVTPIIDGLELSASTFSAPSAPGSFPEETRQVSLYLGKRGTALAVRVRTLSLLGDTEIVDIQPSFAVIRVAP